MDIIIGAGISGLSYANFQKSSKKLILESESEIGGYCRTINQDGFIWDYSGHFFHFRHDDIKKYVLDGMPGVEILEVNKSAQIFVENTYVDFPFQKNIHQLPRESFLACLRDLIHRQESDSESFKKMLISNYGRSISDKFLIPYNEKLYACDLDSLDSDAMGRFFPHASLKDIVDNFIAKDSRSYNSTFTYPRYGAIEYIKSLHRRIGDTEIHLDSRVTRIDLENRLVFVGDKSYKYSRLISSMPLPTLLSICGLDWDPEIFTWNKVLVFNMGFDRKGDDSVNNWVYFPDKELSFYRIGYYDNIFDDKRMSLYVELGFSSGDEIDIEYWKTKVLADLKKVGVITDQLLVSYKAIIMDPAYVHVNGKADKLKKDYKAYLEGFDVYSIGRYGDWKYCSIEDNILEARELSEKLKAL